MFSLVFNRLSVSFSLLLYEGHMPDARFRKITTVIQIKTNLLKTNKQKKQLTLFSLVFVLARSVLYIFHGMKL